MDGSPSAVAAPASAPEVASVPPAGGAGADEAAALAAVKDQLEALRQNAVTAFDRVSADLQRLRGNPVQQTVSQDGMQRLQESLASLAKKHDELESLLNKALERLPSKVIEPTPPPDLSVAPAWAVAWQNSIAEQMGQAQGRVESLVKEIQVQVTELAAEAVDDVEVLEPEVVEPEEPAASSAGWLRVMLGNSLYENPQLESSIRWIEQHVLADDADAMLLLGQLLVFRFASSDKKPTLLKDVGEAFYRCFPKVRDASDSLEVALAGWLTRECEAVGLPNSIELVHPGDRFDALKHAPIERGGVEIARVQGWVVLRDGGRVFSKAAVATR